MHHLAVDVGEPHVASSETYGEAFVIDAHEMEHRRVQIVDLNGILDITLKLTPQGSAVDTDDSIPEAPDIRIDLGDESDDDDEDDDGGIPIF